MKTRTMFHGTPYVNHDSIMRQGLRPAPHGGPYVTPVREEAIGYGCWAAQAHRRATGVVKPQVIVYRLRIPEDALQPAKVEGRHKHSDEFCVPGGVPRDWFVDAELGGLPDEPEVSDELATRARAIWRTLDVLASLGVEADLRHLIGTLTASRPDLIGLALGQR